MKPVGLCFATAFFFASVLSTKAENDAEFTKKFNKKIEIAKHYGGKQKLNFAVPEEGYYSCQWQAVGGKPLAIASEETIYKTSFKGFNLYADGTMKLRGTNKQFDKRVFHWRHNLESGRVVFLDGPLSKSFEWPTHESYWSTNRWVSMLAVYRPMNSPMDLRHSTICKNKDNIIPIEK